MKERKVRRCLEQVLSDTANVERIFEILRTIMNTEYAQIGDIEVERVVREDQNRTSDATLLRGVCEWRHPTTLTTMRSALRS